MEIIFEYIQLFSSSIIKEDQRYLSFEFSNLSHLSRKLPENLIEQDFFNYTIKHYVEIFDSLDEFNENIETVHGGILTETEGIIKVKIDKRKLLISLNPNIKNGFIFVNFKNLIKNHSTISPTIEIDYPHKSHVFIVNFDDLYFENDYLILNDFKNIKDQESMQIKYNNIEKFKLILSIYDSKDIQYISDIPYFYHFDNQNDVINPLKDLALDSFFHLISNKKKNGNNKYLIKGHHNLEIQLDEDIININTNLVTEILDFTLDSERHYDKLLILRNVLTTYLTNFSNKNQINEQLENIKATSQHHFELYIQNEIKIFIEQKNQVLNETLTLAKQVTTFTNEVTNNLRTVLLTLFAGIIASIIPQISDNISNLKIILLLIISYIIYLVVNLFNIKFINNQLSNALNNFKNYTIYISSQSLHGLDYATLKEQFIKKEEENFFKVVLLSKVCIIILLIICIIVLLYISKDFSSNLFSHFISKEKTK